MSVKEKLQFTVSLDHEFIWRLLLKVISCKFLLRWIVLSLPSRWMFPMMWCVVYHSFCKLPWKCFWAENLLDTSKKTVHNFKEYGNIFDLEYFQIGVLLLFFLKRMLELWMTLNETNSFAIFSFKNKLSNLSF